MKEKMILIIIITAALTACAPHFHLDFMGKDRIQEVVLTESKTKTNNKILVIDLNGAITNQTGGGILDREGDPVSKIYYRLKKASEDPAVKGIILRLDTPGGDVTTSDIIYKEVLRFKEKTGLPVVALMMGVAASGGYYVACGADAVVASPGTITGSIGVGAILPTFQRSLAAVGVNTDGFGTTELTGEFSPLMGLGEAGREIIDISIRSAYDVFTGKVATARSMDQGRVNEIAQGRVWIGGDALEIGLVDNLGGIDDAIASAASLAGLEAGEYEIDYVARELSFSERLLLQYARLFGLLFSFTDLGGNGVNAVLQRLAGAVGSELAVFELWNDPRGIYYHCFCEIR